MVELPQNTRGDSNASSPDAGTPAASMPDAAAGSGCGDTRGCCVSDDDCLASARCVSGVCQSCDELEGLMACALPLCPGPNCPSSVPSCSDGIQNGKEADVDCGGDCSTRCSAGAACGRDTDCVSGLICSASQRCSVAACDDGRRDGAEVDVDCGGGTCPGCGVGSPCNLASDCATSICSSGFCATTPECADGRMNGNETDVDCGGTSSACPRCADGKQCSAGTDCQHAACQNGTCISCQDGVQNGAETGIDCGGTDPGCNPCPVGQSCRVAGDCASASCVNRVCVSCSDGRRDGTETGIDCGGSDPKCPRCAAGGACSTGTDCASGTCSAGVCVACNDGVLNGGESDVDCGGPNSSCARCDPGKLCASDSDCASKACEGGHCCGGSQGDCTRCAERLSPSIDCDVPTQGQDSTGVGNCRAFLQCLADHPAICATRTAAGCSGDDPTDACPHNTYGGNAGTGLTRANQVLQNAGCQL
jgi:hypothetical protein